MNFHLRAVAVFKGLFNLIIPELVIKVFFSIFSFAIALSDIKTGMVPRVAFMLAFPVFTVLCILSEDPHPPEILAMGTLLGLFVFLTACFVSRKKLGLADVWYSALIGLVLGPWLWYVAVFCACITGIIHMFAFKKRKIPFIPLMALGSAVVIFFQIFF
jgi:prepilin signal peptidase PulO-like enzyme (type II secretory pathway)